MKTIRIAVLDDSAVFRSFLTRGLGAYHDIEIVESFSDPIQALARIAGLNLDVVVADMEMPRMRGNEFLREMLPANRGVKALVISSRSENVFDAMRAGAVDFIEKPGGSITNDAFMEELVDKIHVAAEANTGAIRVRSPLAAPKPSVAAPAAPAMTAFLPGVQSRSLITIGASTGGTEAILEVVRKFPAACPGVVVVQHMPPVFTKMYAERLDRVCALTVREAEDGDRVEQGVMLIAPGGERQMRLDRDAKGYFVRLTREAKVSGHCPSVDVLFESVAAKAGASAVGVILTGMGADGANGITKMRRAGAYTFGQDEASCIVYGMPKVAFDQGGVAKQLPLREIGNAVMQRFRV
jgi:two-component system chemotaxis response regulator CheB